MAQKAVIDQIYDKIITLFGNEQQMFTMEFPGRVLDEATYTYEANSIYSLLTKPQVIAEEEFRLSNDLFDVARITGGPNGKKLAATYETALNMFIPAFSSAVFEKDKAKLRHWLMEKVQEATEAVPLAETRMERYNRLNKAYLQERDVWEQTKNDRLRAAKDAGTAYAMEEYTRWLASEAPVQEAKIENLFADVVVSGYYHEVRSYLGYLDVKSPAELLDEAKSRLRLTGLSSLDESETIYPVQFQPADWFKSLSTDFTPVDLTMDPELLEIELIQKQNELADLQTQYQLMQSAPTGDIEKLKGEVMAAQSRLDEAQTQMINNFAKATITIAQIVIAKVQQSQSRLPSLTEINDELKGKKKSPLTQEEWDQLLSLQEQATKAQQELITASTQLTELQSQLAAAEATDTKSVLILMKNRIDKLQKEVHSLETFVMAFYAPDKDLTVDAKQQMMPTNMPPAGQFMDVVLSFDSSEEKQSSQLYSGSSHSQYSVDLLFGSIGGSSNMAWSSFVDKYAANKSSFSIGFRATKVTIDRGGWFNPQFFGFGPGSMVNLVKGTKVANARPAGSPHEWTGDQLRALQENALLPAYPISFIIVKDVTLKIAIQETDKEVAQSVLKQASSSGGGFLCFSASSSSANSSTSKSFYFSVDESNIIIKIPGPQIIGWFMEFVPEDKSVEEYQPMPSDFLQEDQPAKELPSDGAGGPVPVEVPIHRAFVAQAAATSVDDYEQ
ncbi:MAG: hypothetical protein WCC10_14075 [Tumebacillaceae bacterium]